MTRKTLGTILTSMVIAYLVAGCGAVFDTAYALGDGKYHESVTDNRPTEHSEQLMEYEVDASLGLQCFARTRQIERSASIHKTYEYRGGFAKSTYAGAAIADGVIGSLIAGTMLAICAQEDSDVSCVNTVWASPFAVDLIYSLIRRKSVRDPVLAGKTRSSDSLVHSETPIDEQQTDCSDVTAVWLGTATGPSREQRLNSGGGERELSAEAIEIPMTVGALPPAQVPGAPPPSPTAGGPAAGPATPHLFLSPGIAEAWATQSQATLWVQRPNGSIARIKVDRCTALRPLAFGFKTDARAAFDRGCPLPAPSNGR